MAMTGTHGEFSVYQYFKDGTYEKVRDHVGAEEAVMAAKHYTMSIAAQLGMVVKVLVEDGGGFTNFLWERDKGIVFPTPADGLRPDLVDWRKA